MSQVPLIIAALGDSITLAGEVPEEARWTELVRTRMQDDLPARAVRIINAGVGGETSREGLLRVERDVIRHAPHYVTVEFGGNDATPEPGRHVSVAEFRSNLDAIRRKVRTAARAQIVVLTFPPVIDAWHAYGGHEFFEPWGGPDACVEMYREAAREFARAHGLPVADIDRAMRVAIEAEGPERFIQPDGVHLTEGGNRVVADEVYRVLSGLMPA